MLGERPERILDAKDGFSRPDSEIEEVPVLLTIWQVHALEAAAHQRGMTAGEALRLLIEDFLRHGEKHPPLKTG